MKVICIMDFIVSPISEVKGCVKQGKTYTVKREEYGYSTFGKRYVEAYELYEVDGLYEKGIFIPLSNLDEKLIHLLRTKPLRKNKATGSKE